LIPKELARACHYIRTTSKFQKGFDKEMAGVLNNALVRAQETFWLLDVKGNSKEVYLHLIVTY